MRTSIYSIHPGIADIDEDLMRWLERAHDMDQ